MREGRLGEVRLAYAEVNWGRIESWHPAPQSFYAVGPLYDVGVYPLTILTAIFGPVQRVTAYGKVLYPDRKTKTGDPFSVTTPDFAVSLLDMASGAAVRLTTNFYVGHHNKQTGIEFHGDEASLYLSNWHSFDAPVQFSMFGENYEDVPHLREPSKGTPWGRGVWEMATAILEDRPHRFTGAQAAHVVEVLDAATRSMTEGCPVEVTSTFTPPEPMAWAQ
jgi:predicted dehydrogenase